MPTVQFAITDEEKYFLDEYAKRKGLKLSPLAKMALFQYAHRFPCAGLKLVPDKTLTLHVSLSKIGIYTD